MELLEILGINWKILLGQIINFLIVLFLFKKFAFGPFFKVLEERRRKINEGVRKSEELTQKINEIKKERDKILKKAQEEALTVVRQSESKGQQIIEKFLEEAEKQRGEIIQLAKEQALEETKKLKEKEKERIKEMALCLAERILEEKIDSEKDKEIIEGFLEQLEAAKK